MTERFRPHLENPKQNSPEAGAGPLGVSPPKTEQAQPQQESTAHNPLAKMREEIRGDGRGVFKCALPKIIFSPFEIQRMYDHEITKEQALQEGQPWVENLKAKDKQRLEQMLESIEKFKRERFPRVREKWRTQKQAELLEYEIEAIREELRHRGS